MAVMTGIEPALSDVTDRCFNLLNYGAILMIAIYVSDGQSLHPLLHRARLLLSGGPYGRPESVKVATLSIFYDY